MSVTLVENVCLGACHMCQSQGAVSKTFILLPGQSIIIWQCTIEGLRTRKVKKHKHVRTRKVKKHTLGEFQFSSPNVTLVCPLKTKMTVLKNMKNVLFYLSWQHAFVLFYLSCPEPFNCEMNNSNASPLFLKKLNFYLTVCWFTLKNRK